MTINELENKHRKLILKKAMLLSDIQSLSEVEEPLFTQLGKVVAEIWQVDKEIVRKTENIFD